MADLSQSVPDTYSPGKDLNSYDLAGHELNRWA